MKRRQVLANPGGRYLPAGPAARAASGHRRHIGAPGPERPASRLSFQRRAPRRWTGQLRAADHSGRSRYRRRSIGRKRRGRPGAVCGRGPWDGSLSQSSGRPVGRHGRAVGPLCLGQNGTGPAAVDRRRSRSSQASLRPLPPSRHPPDPQYLDQPSQRRPANPPEPGTLVGLHPGQSPIPGG